MFICLLIASRGNGGLEKHVRELSLGLHGLGHRVLVVGDEVFIRTLPKQIETVTLNMRLGRYNLLLLYRLWQLLNKFSPQIIHAQADKAACMLSAIAWCLNTPVIATLHNIKKNYTIYTRFKHVICVSQYLASKVKAPYCKVIYNGIATDENLNHLQIEVSRISHKPILCAIGRLVPAKGFDVLLDAVDGLPLQLIIAGEGEMREVLKKRILSMHQTTEVQLIGHCENVVALMKACDGVIISSRKEGFSYVLNEALLHNVNVISTDVPVANEVLPSQLIVPTENAIALRKKIIEMLENQAKWQSLLIEAKAFTKTSMTLDQMVKQTVDKYQSMLNTNL